MESVLKRSVEYAHRDSLPQLEVSPYHLAVQLRSGYERILIALLDSTWASWSDADPHRVAQHLLALAQRANPQQFTTDKRGPKINKPKGYVDKVFAQAHLPTAKVLKQTKAKKP